MFYPQLSRRSQYSSPYGKGGFFSDYKKYADEIATDCQNRCVYCDAKTSENMGGDAFQLDHFRPQDDFSHLKCDPNNLVLACPACNRFKWNHWPAGTGTDETHLSGKGFIDPFNEDRLEYFEISTDGHISPKQDPGAYIVGLLHLDRPARNNMRRRRLIQKEALVLMNCAREQLLRKREEWGAGKIPNEELDEALNSYDIILHKLQLLLKTFA